MTDVAKVNKKKIEIVQAMRGIAALGVVYFHTEYGPWQSANWGVDFFFILSGYFLMMSTESDLGGGTLLEEQAASVVPAVLHNHAGCCHRF